jgi:pimeloyl-ACP methyl ester carboxylesterase
MPAAAPSSLQTVTSADGTPIGYEVRGSGPAVVLVQGAMGTAYNFRDLADALAPHLTVVLPDRRGRGHSGEGRSAYELAREIEDLDAVVRATGAHGVFGLSSGGVVALWAGLRLPALRRVAVYEPPLFADDAALPRRDLDEFDRAIAHGKTSTALVAGMRAGQFAPRIIASVPTPVLSRLVGLGLRREAAHPPVGYAPMADLGLALAHDFALLREVTGRVGELAALPVPLLALGGSRSQAYLRRSLDLLVATVPGAQRVELAGLDHGSPWNTERRGRPEPVAAELVRWFATMDGGPA